jgi:hypothetical protein
MLAIMLDRFRKSNIIMQNVGLNYFALDPCFKSDKLKSAGTGIPALHPCPCNWQEEVQTMTAKA